MGTTSRPQSKREMAQEAYVLSKQFCQLHHRWACWRGKAESISRNKCFLMSPCFQWAWIRDGRKARNETQTKATHKWHKPLRTTMDSWRSEWIDVCKQCEGKSNKEILWMLRGWEVIGPLPMAPRMKLTYKRDKVDLVQSYFAALSNRLGEKLKSTEHPWLRRKWNPGWSL